MKARAHVLHEQRPAAGSRPGSAPSTRASAGGPPVEAAMPTIAGRAARQAARRGLGAAARARRRRRRRITGTWLMMKSCVQIASATAS